MSDVPTVTVLIPARNEEADLERCLQAVLAQDHPHDRMEVVLVDGGSTDRTGEVASRVLAAGDVDWKVVDNPTGTTPSSLNAGLAVATGDILCRVDARSLIPSDYVSHCLTVLDARPEVVVTGGRQVARGGDAHHRGIARGLNNPYLMGGARYRSKGESGAGDTVYLGAFRTDELRAVGGWDEYFVTNQDFELNQRMRERGIIWVDADLAVGYIPRRSVPDVVRQYHRFGRWKVRFWRHTGRRPLARQWVLVLAPLAAGGIALGWLVRRFRPGPVVALATAGVAGLVAVDAVGAEGSASPYERAIAATTLAAVGGGWLSGVVRALLTGER